MLCFDFTCLAFDRFLAPVKKQNTSQKHSKDLVAVTFRFHGHSWRTEIPRQEFFKLPVNSLTGFQLRVSEADQKNLNIPGIIVFQARITPTFDIEQTGSGIPCKTEEKAKELLRIIEAKNNPAKNMVVFSWDGGFGLGAMSNMEPFYEGLILFPLNPPTMHEGNLCGFSIRHMKYTFDNAPEILKEEILPTTIRAEADKLFAQYSQEISNRKKELATRADPQNPKPNLVESQFKVLSKLYPETIRLLKTKDPKNASAAYEAYKRENFALTGEMDGSLIFTKEQFDATAKVISNRRRKRKTDGIDPIEFELVAGWFSRGYSRMTPEQRVEALKKRKLSPPSAEAIRKICVRLKLPPVRKPGFH